MFKEGQMTLRGPAGLTQLLVEAKEGAQASAFCHRDQLRDSHLSFLCATLPLSGPGVFLASTKAIPGQAHPMRLLLCSGVLQEVACISSL